MTLQSKKYDIMEQYETELDAFSIIMKDKDYSILTQREYMLDIRRFLGSVYPKPVEDITKLDVMRYLTSIRKGGTGGSARNRQLSSIRTFFKFLNLMEIIKGNPALEVEKTKVEKNRIPTYLDEQELVHFFQEIDGRYVIRNVAICMLMAYAGLRVIEIHRLNLKDYHRDEEYLRVKGKGDKWRVVPLLPEIIDSLDRYMPIRIPHRSGKDIPLFTSQFGRRIARRTVQHVTEQAFAAFQESKPENEKKLSSHKLRHSFATLHIRSGTDIRSVQELLGHSSIENTQIYTHVDNKQLRAAQGNIKGKLPALK